METKKIIITGSTGQLGSFMIDYLLKNTEHNVIAAIRRTSQIIDAHIRKHEKNERFRIVHFDLIDVHSIDALIKNEQPDYFINFGAQTFVHDSWSNPISHFKTNAISMIHILEAVRNFCKKCRVYSSGSSEQFGDVICSPQDINHPFRPRSPYGASKAACHNIVKVWRESYGLYVVQGILFNNESCRRQEYFVTRKITKGVARIYHAIKNGKSFEPIELGNLDAKRDWSDSEDFVDGVWKMLNQKTPKDYVLSSNETHSIREFIEIAFNEAGIDGVWHGSNINEEYSVSTKYAIANDPISSILVKINEKFYRPAEVDLLMGDSTPARKELGWSPNVDFKTLVKKMVAHDISILDKIQ